MDRTWIVITVLAFLFCVGRATEEGDEAPARPKYEPIQFTHPLHAGCKFVNSTSGVTVRERSCDGAGNQCSCGPLAFEWCDGTPMEAWFCKETQTLMELACKLKSVDPDSPHQFVRDCKCSGSSTCDMGAIELEALGQKVNATYCRPSINPDLCNHNPGEGAFSFVDTRKIKKNKTKKKKPSPVMTSEELDAMARRVGYGTRDFDADESEDDENDNSIFDDERDDEESDHDMDWKQEMTDRKARAKMIQKFQAAKEAARAASQTPEAIAKREALRAKKLEFGGTV